MTKTNEIKDLKGKGKAVSIEEIAETTEAIIEDLDVKEEVAKIEAVYNDNNGESSNSQATTKNNSTSKDISIRDNNLLARVNLEVSKSFNEEIEKSKITPQYFKEVTLPVDNPFWIKEGETFHYTNLPVGKLLKSEPISLNSQIANLPWRKQQNFSDRLFNENVIDLEALEEFVSDIEKKVDEKNLVIYNKKEQLKDNAWLTIMNNKDEENEKKIEVLEKKLTIIKSNKTKLQNDIRNTEERDRLFREQEQTLINQQNQINNAENRYNTLFHRWRLANFDLETAKVHINSLTMEIENKEKEVESWEESYNKKHEKLQAEGIANGKMRHILLTGKNKLEELTKDVDNLKEEKRVLEHNLKVEKSITKKLREELDATSIFDGAYETISATVNKPIDFIKDYAGNWMLEKIWLGIYLVLFLLNLFIFLTQASWKLFFTLTYSASLLVIKNYFPTVSLKSNFIYSLLITIGSFLAFYSLKWIKKLFIYIWKKASEKFGKKELDHSKNVEFGILDHANNFEADKRNLDLENYFEKVRTGEEVLDLKIIKELLEEIEDNGIEETSDVELTMKNKVNKKKPKKIKL